MQAVFEWNLKGSLGTTPPSWYASQLVSPMSAQSRDCKQAATAPQMQALGQWRQQPCKYRHPQRHTCYYASGRGANRSATPSNSPMQAPLSSNRRTLDEGAQSLGGCGADLGQGVHQGRLHWRKRQCGQWRRGSSQHALVSEESGMHAKGQEGVHQGRLHCKRGGQCVQAACVGEPIPGGC